VGSNARQDVTLDYKYKEGTIEERAAFGPTDTANADSDLDFKLELSKPVPIGKTVEAKIIVKKTKGNEKRTVKCEVVATVIRYNGRSRADIKSQVFELGVSLGVGVTQSFQIAPEDYQKFLGDDHTIQFTLFASASGSNQTALVQKRFDFLEGDIKLTLVSPKKLVFHKSGRVKVVFTNPLDQPLNNARLNVEGANLTKAQSFDFKVVPKFGTISQEIEVYAWQPGSQTIAASFESTELTQVTGHTVFEVLPK